MSLRRAFQLTLSRKMSTTNVVPVVDVLGIVKHLELHGFTTIQAQGLATAINDNLVKATASLASKDEIQQPLKLHETLFMKIEHGVLLSREHQHLMAEYQKKRLQHELECLCREVKAVNTAEIGGVSNKFDHEMHKLRADFVDAKYDMFKVTLGTLVSISTVVFGVVRTFM